MSRLTREAAKPGSRHTILLLKGYDHGGFLDFSWPTVVEASLDDVFGFFANYEKPAKHEKPAP